MSDSDDPCDGIEAASLTGWIKSDNSNTKKEKNKKEIVPLSYARFEHG
jgi:hypothetical protein